MHSNNWAVFAAGNSHYKPIRRKLPLLGLLLGAACASVSGFAADSTGERARYKLRYIDNTLGSTMISAGDFNAARQQIADGLMLHEPYERHTNLCVTLISLQSYEQAGASCRAAVRYSKPRHHGLQAQALGVSERRAHKNRRALALSNLGVLQALKGQYDRARRSLEKSTARYLQNSEVGQYNLSVLSQREGMTSGPNLALVIEGT